MKNTFNKSTLIFSILFFPIALLAQDLTKRGLELRAHYPLKSDGVDVTGNYDPVSFGNHVFVDSSILSKGCSRINDTCLIGTPQINDMNDNAFAIRVDFKVIRFGGPIVLAGRGYRYLGLATTGEGQFGIKTGSQNEIIFGAVLLELDKWYTATILHNTADWMTEVYLNDKFIAEYEQILNHPEDDNAIANIDYSRGYSFSGYLRNLQVYSADLLKASDGDELTIAPLTIFPNPAANQLNINIPVATGMKYQITDLNGRIIQEDGLYDDAVTIDAIMPGMYLLSVYEEGVLVNRGRFVKN